MSNFGWTYTKIGMIQRRLAWPLRKDDTQNREAFHIFCFRIDLFKILYFTTFYIFTLKIILFVTFVTNSMRLSFENETWGRIQQAAKFI